MTGEQDGTARRAGYPARNHPNGMMRPVPRRRHSELVAEYYDIIIRATGAPLSRDSSSAKRYVNRNGRTAINARARYKRQG